MSKKHAWGWGALLGLVSVSAWAEAPVYLDSAIRYPGESVQQAFQRYRQRLESVGLLPTENVTAVDLAKPLAQLDASRAPVWADTQGLHVAFSRVRDERFLNDPDRQGFKRRSSWLFPDDGCYARAQLAVANLQSWGHVRPAKVFIFGNLSVKTANSPRGSVSWWYHVVPVVKVGQQLVVFDPAIHPASNLTLQQWISTMTPDPASVTLAVCHADTFVPRSDCLSGDASATSQGRSVQVGFLRSERSRVQELGMDPEKVLGDLPPWKSAP